MSCIFRYLASKILNSISKNLAQNGGPRNLSLFKSSPEVNVAYGCPKTLRFHTRQGLDYQHAESPYIIVRATNNDYNQILKIMHETYFIEEPTVAYLKIGPNPVSDEVASKAMAEGYTLVARCKYDGCIVGACINSSSNPWDPDLKENLACKVKDRKLRQLMMFNAFLQRLPDIWNCLGVQKVFEMEYLFVRQSHRKKGIGYRLLKDSKAMGADSGFGVVRCDATSEFTARLCEKLKMQKIAELPYCKYLNAKLEPVFSPSHPHKSVKVYADCAPQLSEYINSRKKPSKKKKSKSQSKIKEN